MTTKKSETLIKLEQSMREHAIAVNNCSVKMQDINPFAARNALKGIIEYLQDALNDIPATTTIGELAERGEIPS
ncbi:MAG TPA: hypothetical protein PLN38_16850 [Chitinophagales bacterium]|nr:hypothetical protein [Chitinophagales bacterium]